MRARGTTFPRCVSPINIKRRADSLGRLSDSIEYVISCHRLHDVYARELQEGTKVCRYTFAAGGVSSSLFTHDNAAIIEIAITKRPIYRHSFRSPADPVARARERESRWQIEKFLITSDAPL